MDMSKLPRLSRTGSATASESMPADPGDGPPRRLPASDPYDSDRASFLIEAWFSIGLGLLLLIIFPTMTQYASSKVFHTRFAPYAYTDETGNQTFVDFAPMLDGSKIPYRQTTPANTPNFWNDFVITSFALALIVEGVALVLSRRPAVVALALVVTVLATLVNLLFFLKTFREYGVPLMSAMAVLVGVYMAFSQMRLWAWRTSPAVAPVADAVQPRIRVDPTDALLGKVLGGEPKVRCTHYKFAHQALRQAAMENPAKCVGLLQSPVAQRFLNDLWEAVRTGCMQSAGPAQTPEPGPQGLEADMTQVGPYSAVIVALPKPQVPTEAFFVAMVLRSYVRAEDGLTIDRHPLLLYYTLEHGGAREDGPPRTILGEWQAGTHLSYGDGPAPDASAFRDAVREKVDLLQKREDEAAGKTSFV